MKSAGKFEKLGLRSGFDFVLHLPLRYEDETALTAPQCAPLAATLRARPGPSKAARR